MWMQLLYGRLRDLYMITVCNLIKSERGVGFMENKVFGYARVSTSHQSTDRQIEALVKYGVSERDIITDYQSGKDFQRQGYLSLKENMLRKGDTLVVKELDRLGRDKRMIKEELEYFKAQGIRVKILNIPTTLMEIEGNEWVLEMVNNVLIEVLGTIAQEERVKNHVRQREGIDAAMAKGVEFGRPKLRKPDNYEEVMARVVVGEITGVQAMKLMGVKKTSYYKLKRLYPVCN